MIVKKVIKERGFTMTELANKMGINPVTLSQNLQNQPSMKTLSKIAEVIGCKVVDFFADEAEIPMVMVDRGTPYIIKDVSDLVAFLSKTGREEWIKEICDVE